jgi:biotin carboxyl carrier protein
VTEILCSDGDAIEFGQTLVVIQWIKSKKF